MATESVTQSENADTRSLAPVDRGLYALFSRRADSQRHERDRHRYRATNLGVSFEVYLARVYGCAWLVALLALAATAGLSLLLPPSVVDSAAAFLQSGLPVVDRLSLPVVPPALFGVGVGAGVGLAVRWATVRLGGRYLYWRAQARRGDIEATLPAAVRYLRVLSSGSSDQREMLRRIATQDVYGETGVAFRRALNEATLTGSLEAGLERVARDTPSRDLLAPFLLKYREHASQGTDSLSEFLRMEGRLLSHRQARTHERVSGYLELLAELFVVLLVLPALLVLIVTVMSVLAPGLSQTVPTPLGPVTMRAVAVYGSAAFVVVVGLAAAATVETVRPTQQATPTYEAPDDVTAVLATAPINPASAAVVTAAVAPGIALALWMLGYAPLNVALLGYVAFGLPVGLVAVRRARRDDAKDREIRDFVHAVSGHVALGRPFSEAVERVAGEVDHGALQADVDTLAFTLSLTTDAGDGEGDVRAAALDRFVDEVGTPLARQTIGLVVGALDAGSDTEQVFESLETEIGRLYHERKELRSTLLVYVAVGWTTGLLVLGIVLAVNAFVLDGFAQLSTVSGATGRTAMALDPDAIDPERARRRFYAVTQGTMLACGWFAGVASRGRYEALLHSSILVAITYVVFAGAGMV
jgi:archaellum biogenesis protein FlaJ (TadC family)